MKAVTNKQRREESDARIINAAIKNFSIHGYTNASISQIAADAGISPGLITNRYSSKVELFEKAFERVYQELIIDYSNINTARNFLIALINAVIDLYKKDIVSFEFMAMVYVGYDKPEEFKDRAREEFSNTKGYKLLVQAQAEGIIPKGDVVNLVDAFLAHAYIQIGICNRYGLELPSIKYFLSSILRPDSIDDESYQQQFLNLLLKEYQSAWLINIADESMQIYTYDEKKAAPKSVQAVQKLQTYNEARLWYIENCVVEQSKAKLLKETALDYVLSKVCDEASFFVEYGRIINGEINYNQLCYNKVVNKAGDIEYIAMGFRNIDVAKKAEIDDLTGLLTRQAFFREAEAMLLANPDQQFDISISDIIDFKKINETYGVLVADNILKWEGRYLSAIQSDEVVMGRYGGDQMVMFGTHEFISSCMNDESRIRFWESKNSNNLPEIEIKFGIYEDVRHDRSIIASCDKAHMALNTIKHHYGKDIAYYGSDIKEKLEKQRRIENSMHKSLKNGDFKVYYQPKHDAKTGKLAGAEALIRWIHPEYGFMNPGDFIPLFEQNGFIVENDRFVWRRTCENLKRWIDKGIPTVPISVNASKLTMSNEDVISNMKEAVLANGLSADQLHVEITETLMSENIEDLVEKLNEIRTIGFKVELDDFGSGYSSINVLSTLPIDILKLDMSFLQQFGDEKRYTVLESCIDLAKKLGYKTVSEGVELSEQKEKLGKLGVDMIQGYLYSKPLPEDEFEKYLIKNL